MNELALFLDQNPLFAAGLNDEDRSAAQAYAQHHAGGLFVLQRDLGGSWVVKAHDSWGDDGRIVVHRYDADADGTDSEHYFTDGHAALAAFLSAELGDS